MTNLRKVEGIGEQYAQKLADAGIKTTEALLKKGANPQGRKAIAEATGLSPKLILGWVNRVDLFRIKGVGEEYADLLEHAGVDTVKELAGVDTVPELAQRNPGNLYQKMVEVNEEKKLVRQLPTEAKVVDWVAQAKELPRKITY